MCVLLITRLLRGVGRWARKPVNHTSWVAVVTPTDRPKSVRNCCLIELFCDVVCVATLPLWHFCWYRGFCHRTGSDLLLFLFIFLNFEVKQCANILKVRQYRICNGKEAKLFFHFFKIAYTPHKSTIRHIALLHLSNFLFKIHCFHRDENDFAPDDQHYIRGKGTLCVLQHFWRTITLAVLDIHEQAVSTESQVVYLFIIKVRMDTPVFYFLIFFW